MDTNDDGGVPDGYEPDDGFAHLEDLGFDFEDYFARAREERLSALEWGEFDARILGLYCRDTYANKIPPAWVRESIANEFFKVLAGGDSRESFPMPWSAAEAPPQLSRAAQLALDIFRDIADLMHINPELKITAACKQIGDVHHVSYETARAAWYKHKPPLKSF